MDDAELIAAVEVLLADAGELDRSATASLLGEVAWSLGDFTDHPPSYLAALTFDDESMVELSQDAVDSRLKRLRECRRAVRPLEGRDARGLLLDVHALLAARREAFTIAREHSLAEQRAFVSAGIAEMRDDQAGVAAARAAFASATTATITALGTGEAPDRPVRKPPSLWAILRAEIEALLRNPPAARPGRDVVSDLAHIWETAEWTPAPPVRTWPLWEDGLSRREGDERLLEVDRSLRSALSNQPTYERSLLVKAASGQLRAGGRLFEWPRTPKATSERLSILWNVASAAEITERVRADVLVVYDRTIGRCESGALLARLRRDQAGLSAAQEEARQAAAEALARYTAVLAAHPQVAMVAKASAQLREIVEQPAATL